MARNSSGIDCQLDDKRLTLAAMIEVIKILVLVLIPSGLVLYTASVMLRKYFANQLQIQKDQQLTIQRSEGVQIKLQAYERLILYMERLDITQLLLRLRTASMTNTDLYNSLMISIQKEFEHNQVQQLYISDQLWEIIKTAKDNVLSLIMSQYELVDPNGKSEEFAQALVANYKLGAQQSISTAQSAIKKETRLIL